MKVASLELFRVRLPFRIRFEHRAATRKESVGLLTKITLKDGSVGWGEGIPREYVTGETAESSAEEVREFYAPRLGSWDPADFDGAAEASAGLPSLSKDGRVFNAARCTVELALLDAYARSFQRDLSEAALPRPETAVTAVLPAGGALKVRGLYAAFWAAGFRDFKLKVGCAGDERRFKFILSKIGGARPAGITVRADANGAWTAEEAERNMASLMRRGVKLFEQPLAKDDWAGYRRLAAAVGPQAIILDESLLTVEDAQRAAREGICGGFNIRISKNGGFHPALEVARLAASLGIRIHLGSMVGESSLLAAARRHLQAAAPPAASVEPSFSRFLLKRDLASSRRQARGPAGHRGDGRNASGGWGVDVDERAVARLGESVFKAGF